MGNEGKYALKDIVLPLLGYETVQPKYLHDLYVSILKKENIALNKLENTQQPVFSLRGGYRSIVSEAVDFEYEIKSYETEGSPLVPSPLDQEGEITFETDGHLKALVLKFKLASSTYATMLYRELLRVDTSKQSLMLASEIQSKKVKELNE